MHFEHRRGEHSGFGGAALMIKKSRHYSYRPVSFQERRAWCDDVDAARVDVTFHALRADVAFYSIYAHQRGDINNFKAFCRSARNAHERTVLIGDLNAGLQNHGGNGPQTESFKQRAEIVHEELIDYGWVMLENSAPTKSSGHSLDFIIMSPAAFGLFVLTGGGDGDDGDGTDNDDEAATATVHVGLTETDHRPLSFSARLREADAAREDAAASATKTNNVCWRRVTKQHEAHFNATFRHQLERARRLQRPSGYDIVRALHVASRILPKAKRPPPESGPDSFLWWSLRREEDLADAPDQAHETRQQRNETLRHAASRSSVFDICERYLRTKRSVALTTPLKDIDDPTREVVDPEARAKIHLESYRRMHKITAPPPAGQPARRPVQDQLRDALDDIPFQSRVGKRVTLWELQTAIAMMNPGKCYDVDRIKAEHLLLLDDASILAVLPFVNEVVQYGSIPRAWKQDGYTSPVPKPNKPLDVHKGWRPVSVTSVVARLCEHIINLRIMGAWESVPLSNQHSNGGGGAGGGAQATTTPTTTKAQSQFGFRRFTSAAAMLTSLTAFALQGFNTPRAGATAGRQHSLFTGVDGESAFCKTDTAIAVRKLRQLGLHAEAAWVARFLLDRKIRVRLAGVTTESVEQDSGVPQGTVLGPTIWLLLVDGLLQRLEAKCADINTRVADNPKALPITFADDVNFLVRSDSRQTSAAIANELLDVVLSWSHEVGIEFPSVKAMWLVGRNAGRSPANGNNIELSCGNAKCTPTDAPDQPPIRLLGVFLDPHLTFAAHWSAIRGKIMAGMRTLTTLAATLRSDMLRQVHSAFVLSHMLYCCEAWAPFASEEVVQQMRRIHVAACRTIINASSGGAHDDAIAESGYRDIVEITTERIVTLHEHLKRECIPDGATLDNAFGMSWLRLATQQLGVSGRRVVHGGGQPLVDVFASDQLKDEDALPSTTRFCPLSAAQLAWVSALAPPSHFIVTPPGGLVKSNATYAELFAANAARMNTIPADAVRVYVDGACDSIPAGSRGAAAGAFVLEHDGEYCLTGAAAASTIACSYRSECAPWAGAILAVDNFLLDHFRAPSNNNTTHRPSDVYFITDSLSFLLALRKGPIRQHDYFPQRVWHEIGFLCEQRRVRCYFVFVFSHAGVAGNDFADELAEDWRKAIGRSPAPLWLTDSCRFRVGEVRAEYDANVMRVDGALGRLRKPVGPSPSLRPFGLTRGQEAVLFRARLGFFPSIGGHLPDINDPCPLCGAPGVLRLRNNASARHIFMDCPAVNVHLVNLVGPVEGPLHHVRWTHPRETLLYLRLFEQARGAANTGNNDDESSNDGGDSSSSSSSSSTISSSSGAGARRGFGSARRQ